MYPLAGGTPATRSGCDHARREGIWGHLARLIQRSSAHSPSWLLVLAIWATLITVPSLITLAFTRERHATEAQSEGPGSLEGPRIAFRNRAYLAVIAIYLLAWLAVQSVQSNLILYVRYWADAERYFPILILAAQLPGFVSILVWNQVSRRIGKQGSTMSAWASGSSCHSSCSSCSRDSRCRYSRLRYSLRCGCLSVPCQLGSCW